MISLITSRTSLASQNPWFAPILLLVLAFLTIFTGCGGESRGTGALSLEGQILDGGQPVEGVTVTISGLGDQDITDATGRFSIAASEDLSQQEVTLIFEKPGAGLATSSTVQIPTASDTVNLDVEINVRRNQVTAVIVSVPTPVPTVVPGEPTTPSMPTPTATEAPPSPTISQPTVTPSPIPTARACPSDFNHDGVVNSADFDAFSAVFNLGDPAADFDGNGFVNGDDFDQFAAAYESGC